MSKKRRGFDIDLEGDLASDLDGDLASDLDSDLNGEDRSETDTNMAESLQKPAPVTPVRRGPMASAIHETAGSLRARAVVEAQIRAENDALAHEHVRLKALGLITDLIGLDLIDTWKLTRDRARPRAGLDDREMEELASSIREVGLSNPIRVEAQPDGRYELVQGFRRLQAYRALLAETDDAARFGTIPAVIIAQGDTLERLYRQMVDENMVRKDISFAEMAQMAIHYAMDPGTTETDPDKVVAQLFGSASYSKRSYIRRFIRVIEALGEQSQHLDFAACETVRADPLRRQHPLLQVTHLLQQPAQQVWGHLTITSRRRHDSATQSLGRRFIAPQQSAHAELHSAHQGVVVDVAADHDDMLVTGPAEVANSAFRRLIE